MTIEERLERLERLVYALAADSVFENAGIEAEKYYVRGDMFRAAVDERSPLLDQTMSDFAAEVRDLGQELNRERKRRYKED